MWEEIKNDINCNDCNNYVLPPPKFDLPPPPMPQSLYNSFKCNEEELYNLKKNMMKNDLCPALSIIEESVLSSPITQALLLVGFFACMILLVIICSILYVRRIFNKKNQDCNEIKILEKNVQQNSSSNSSENSQSNFLMKRLFKDENFIKGCDERCNRLTSREAHDFIGYIPTYNMSMSSISKQQRQIVNENNPYLEGGYIEPVTYCNNRCNVNRCDSKNYFGNCLHAQSMNSSFQRFQSIPKSDKISNNIPMHLLFKGYSSNLYSIPNEDLEELPIYSGADTGYSGSSDDGVSNNEQNLCSNSRNNRNRNDSHLFDISVINQTYFNNKIIKDISKNYNENVAEYIEIDEVFHRHNVNKDQL